jgi:hypothetical protein
MAYIDFGAAMKVSIGRCTLGTGIRPPLKWAAPEQIFDEPYNACAADVFMLGKVLQEELAEGRIVGTYVCRHRRLTPLSYTVV